MKEEVNLSFRYFKYFEHALWLYRLNFKLLNGSYNEKKTVGRYVGEATFFMEGKRNK